MAGLDPPDEAPRGSSAHNIISPSDPDADGTTCTQPFIVTMSFAKQDPTTRRFIRSHVMRGINKGKPRPRRAAAAIGPAPESATGNGRARMIAAKPIPSCGELVGGSSPAADAGAKESMWIIFTPAKLASELSLTRTTAVLTPPMQQLIYECKIFFPPVSSRGKVIRQSNNY